MNTNLINEIEYILEQADEIGIIPSFQRSFAHQFAIPAMWELISAIYDKELRCGEMDFEEGEEEIAAGLFEKAYELLIDSMKEYAHTSSWNRYQLERVESELKKRLSTVNKCLKNEDCILLKSEKQALVNSLKRLSSEREEIIKIANNF